MGINVFRRAKSAGKLFGKVMNSKAVSTISHDLVKGGQVVEKAGSIANRVLSNPLVEGMALDAGPEGMALYGGLRAGASGAQTVGKGAQQAGKGIQRAKGAVNATSFRP